MKSELWLSEAVESPNDQEPLIRLDEGQVVMGRDADYADICLLDEGISRQHVLFSQHSGNWFVRDLESMNGTYVNCTQLEPGTWNLLRDGDVVELSEIAFRVNLNASLVTQIQEATDTDTNKSEKEPGILHVFSGLEYVGGFSVEEAGTVFSIVQRGKDLQVTIAHPEFSGIQFVSKEGSLVSIDVDKRCHRDYEIFVNGANINASSELKDRDIIQVGSYQIIYENSLDARSEVIQKGKSSRSKPLLQLLNDSGVMLGNVTAELGTVQSESSSAPEPDATSSELPQVKAFESTIAKAKQSRRKAKLSDSLVTVSPYSGSMKRTKRDTKSTVKKSGTSVRVSGRPSLTFADYKRELTKLTSTSYTVTRLMPAMLIMTGIALTYVIVQ